jgi:hypothetical protein
VEGTLVSKTNGKSRRAARVRNCTSLSDDLQVRLNAYALAATAAGVAVLACSPAAEATPVCKNFSLVFTTNNTYGLRPAERAFPPFQIAQTASYYSSSTSGRLYSWNRAFFTPNTAGAKVLLGPGPLVANLASGASIGPVGKFGKPASYGVLFTYGKGFQFASTKAGGTLLKHRGNFDLQKTNYVGFQFLQSGQNHYGWARLRVTLKEAGSGHTVTNLHILGFGYESAANTAIAAGSCGAASSAGEAPSDAPTLGALALGNPGLLLGRGGTKN